ISTSPRPKCHRARAPPAIEVANIPPTSTTDKIRAVLKRIKTSLRFPHALMRKKFGESLRKRADGLVQCGQTRCIEIQIKALEIARNIFHKLRRHLDPLPHDLIHELVRIVPFTLAL